MSRWKAHQDSGKPWTRRIGDPGVPAETWWRSVPLTAAVWCVMPAVAGLPGAVDMAASSAFSAGHVSGRRQRNAEGRDLGSRAVRRARVKQSGAPSRRLGGGRGPQLRAARLTCAVLAGTMISSLLQRVAAGGCRPWWRHPPRVGQRPYFAFASGVRGGEEVDQPAVGVAQDYRAVAPRHVGRLQDDLGDGLGDEALDSLPGRVDVVDAQFDEDRAVLAGHRASVAEHPDGRGGADGDGPGRRSEFGEDRDGPGDGQAGQLLPEGREAFDVAGDDAD